MFQYSTIILYINSSAIVIVKLIFFYNNNTHNYNHQIKIFSRIFLKKKNYFFINYDKKKCIFEKCMELYLYARIVFFLLYA